MGEKVPFSPSTGGMLGQVQMQVECDSDSLSKAHVIQESFGVASESGFDGFAASHHPKCIFKCILLGSILKLFQLFWYLTGNFGKWSAKKKFLMA